MYPLQVFGPESSSDRQGKWRRIYLELTSSCSVVFGFSSLSFFSESRTPIIIIPAGATSLITLYNAQDLLQDFK